MYTTFFGLNEKPFSITPDPRYLFMSERHGEALAHLVYGVTESGGFMQLTGEVGTGKTTLVRTLLQNRLPDNADVAVVLNPQLSALEFLETICEELGILQQSDKGSIKALIDSLNRHLLSAHAEGRRTILVVDEAQNLAPDVLEQVRLLTNLETARQKLLQIILIGQPELRELLARNDLRQLAQRITGRYHLEPLTRSETDQYIEHRLRVAGALGELFDTGAKREVYGLSHGVPRLINVICDRALLGAYSREVRRVSRRLVRRAAAEIAGRPGTPTWLRWAVPVTVTLGLAVIAAGVASLFTSGVEPSSPQTTHAVDDEQPLPEVADYSVPSETENHTEPSEPVPQPDLDEQLALASELTDMDTALTTLFSLWGMEYRGGQRDGCSVAAAEGYACLIQRGSWSSLRQLDRPAILTLTDSRGTLHRVVLTALHGDIAELSIGGIDVTHPSASIVDMWFGQYYLIWKPPNGQSTALTPGQRNPNVVWLRQSLASIDERYRSQPEDSDLYDDELEKRVREFQRDHRLDVDGLAGRHTQIIINSLLALDGTPRLTTPRLAQD